MIRKSTASMNVGHYCLVQRDDRRLVPFGYVGRRGNDRSYFFGAFADTVLGSTQTALPAQLRLREHALVHIKCFKENNTPIVANLISRLDSAVLKSISADIDATEEGSTTRVWGHRTVLKYANDVHAQPGPPGGAPPKGVAPLR